MIKKSYHCDLCNGEFEAEHLIGIHWAGGGDGHSLLKTGDVNKCSSHICRDCAQGIKELT